MAKKKAKPRPRPAQSQTLPSGTRPGGPRKPPQSERLAAARAARKRKETRTRAIVVLVVVLILGVIVTAVVRDRSNKSAVEATLEAGTGCAVDSKSDPTSAAGANHVAKPVYRIDPPAGGNHLASASPPGTFSGASVPPDGQLVHSLEHGYVILWHKPGLADADLAKIQAAADRYEKDTLVVERASLTTPVAATAWGKRLLCDTVNTDTLATFIKSYRNKGPEKVPH